MSKIFTAEYQVEAWSEMAHQEWLINKSLPLEDQHIAAHEATHRRAQAAANAALAHAAKAPPELSEWAFCIAGHAQAQANDCWHYA